MLSSFGVGNSFSKIGFGDNAAIDSFGRLRVSEPAYRFDSQLTYQIDSDLWDIYTTGAGSNISFDTVNRMANLSGAAISGSACILQSHYAPPYTPGRSQLAFLTFSLGTGTGVMPSGTNKRIGLYDESEGIGFYLENNVSGLNFSLKGGTQQPTQVIPRSSWNIDKFDGNGPSRQTFDPTKTQILAISYQALYVGRGIVGFDIDGELFPAHEFLNSNISSYPYIKNANLPIHYSCRTDVATGVSMSAICCSVISEGGEDLQDIAGRNFGNGNGATSIAVTTRRPVYSISVSGQLNGLNSNTLVIPISAEVLSRSNDAYIEIVRNGTLTSAAFTPVDASKSVVTRDVAATAISNGQIIYSFYAPSTTNNKISVEKGLGGKSILAYSHLLKSGDILSVVATSRTATSDIHASINWKEIR